MLRAVRCHGTQDVVFSYGLVIIAGASEAAVEIYRSRAVARVWWGSGRQSVGGLVKR